MPWDHAKTIPILGLRQPPLVLYPYNMYYPRIPYVSEKWNPSEVNDKGAIVQLLKSWICVPNLVVPKNQRLGGCASSVHNHGVHTSWPVNNSSSSYQPFKGAACLQARCFPSSLV